MLDPCNLSELGRDFLRLRCQARAPHYAPCFPGPSPSRLEHMAQSHGRCLRNDS